MSLVSVSGTLCFPFDWTLFLSFFMNLLALRWHCTFEEIVVSPSLYALALTGKDLHRSFQLEMSGARECVFSELVCVDL